MELADQVSQPSTAMLTVTSFPDPLLISCQSGSPPGDGQAKNLTQTHNLIHPVRQFLQWACPCRLSGASVGTTAPPMHAVLVFPKILSSHHPPVPCLGMSSYFCCQPSSLVGELRRFLIWWFETASSVSNSTRIPSPALFQLGIHHYLHRCASFNFRNPFHFSPTSSCVYAERYTQVVNFVHRAAGRSCYWQPW